MNKLFGFLATSTLGLGLLCTAVSAGPVAPSQQDAVSPGVVIVPASAGPFEEVEEHPGFSRGPGGRHHRRHPQEPALFGAG